MGTYPKKSNLLPVKNNSNQIFVLCIYKGIAKTAKIRG